MDIHVNHRDDENAWEVYASSMGSVVLKLGHDVTVSMGKGSASDLYAKLGEVLKPRED